LPLARLRIRSDPAYVAKFNAALPGAAINIGAIVKAIAAFEGTLAPGIARFDRWAPGRRFRIAASLGPGRHWCTRPPPPKREPDRTSPRTRRAVSRSILN
jgi:hypothetical protein